MTDGTLEFAEKTGLFFEDDGYPRIAGRIFGLLLMSEAARSLHDIATRLRVSKASVSTDARLLERWDIVERVSRPGDRKVYYRIVPDLPYRTMEHRLERVRRMGRLMREARAAVPGRGTLKARLSEFAAAYDQALVTMEKALRRVSQAVPASNGGSSSSE
jgi:DNA-binding transcriptional regulator GbsR (MarR family)